MTKTEKRYFRWLVGFINKRDGFGKLLMHLYNTDFFYICLLDENMAYIGKKLRKRFLKEKGNSEDYLDLYLPCNVLEVLVAMAIDLQERVLWRPNEDSHYDILFWTWIDNLSLGGMDDMHFDIEYTEYILRTWLNREYAPNGEGGNIVIVNDGKDLRDISIWEQINILITEGMM